MNNWIRRIICTALFGFGFHALQTFCHQKTRGFSLAKIQTADAPSKEVSFPPCLNQRFSYFADGKQSFVFLSEDGRYVLKFFKRASGFPPAWTGKIPLLNRFKAFRPEKIAQNAWKRERDYTGYRVAFKRCAEETGLVFLHLDASCDPLTIPIVDPLGIEHRLDLSRTHFVLQKKAEPIVQQLLSKDAGPLISDLVAFCKKRAAKGIYDDDPSFEKNFGMLDGRLIQIDPGQYQEQPALAQAEHIFWVKKRFKKWLQYFHPELLSYVDEIPD